jgi:cell division protein FtsI (penicillin-binding protein 3)
MRQMMQGVVLHGTGRKAILEGYSSAGKTGTAQKVDPATHTYSRTKYIASFAGFAPVNNPSIVCVVILDSPIGGHHGGEVGAPVFHRIAQQVLEYLHTPHDMELPPNRLLLAAARPSKDQDVSEGSSDRLGETLDLTEPQETNAAATVPAVPAPQTAAQSAPPVVPAALQQREVVESQPQQAFEKPNNVHAATEPMPKTGTLVLDIEQGGIVVPSFTGKSVRAAIELAEEDGLDLDAVGDGLARDQSPLPGTRVASGAKITVRFAR